MNNTKPLLLWLAIVIGCVAAADLVFGFLMQKYIDKYHLKGDYRTADYLLRENHDDDLVVLGSSVALNSINTAMLSDSLGIKAYNGGSNGQTFPYFQSMLEVIAENRNLKTVILGLAENNLSDTGLGERYNFLAPYYGQGYTGIDRRMENGSRLQSLLLESSMYRYNTAWFRILLYSITEPGIKGQNGFIAKDIPAIFPTVEERTHNISISPERAAQLDSVSTLCRAKDIKLIVCVPPRYENRHLETDVERQLQQRASRGDFTLWFDVASLPISRDSSLFYDNTHLNYRGADIYTRLLTERLR